MAADVWVASIASASIITVGKLFIIDEIMAAIKPMAMVAANNP